MNELYCNARYSLLAIVFVLASWSAPTRGAEIVLRATATPAGRVVRLADLADVSGIDDAQQASLEEIELFPMPAGGEDRTITAAALQDLLANRGVAIGHHQFAGAREVRVTSGAAPARRIVGPAGGAARGAINAVQNAVTAYLAERVDAERGWKVEVDLTDEQIRLVSASFGRIDVAGGAAPWEGEQQFTIIAGGKANAFSIEAFVAPADMVVVAARPLQKGDVIAASDVSLEPAKRAGRSKGAYRSAEEVIGKETLRSIAAGQVLDANYVQAPVLVKRGEVVTVYVYAAGVRLKTTGRTRANGSKGEIVEVESLADRRRFFGRVSDVQTVEVDTSMTAAAMDRQR